MAGLFSRKKDKKAKKEVKKSSKEDAVKQETEEVAEVSFDPKEALYDNLALLERGVSKNDEKIISRVLRKNTPIRRKISMPEFKEVLELYFPSGNSTLSIILDAVKILDKEMPVRPVKPTSMEVEGEDKKPEGDGKEKVVSKAPTERRTMISPEVEAYLLLFVTAKLQEYNKTDESLKLVSVLLEHCKHHNRRTLDLLQARAFHFFARCHELKGSSRSIRQVLLAAHRTACLRFDEIGQATLINLILRNYIEFKLVDQAVKFASRANFPDHVSNNQQVRYLYYMGRLQAIQLDYSDAFAKLMQVVRKTPSHTAFGFRTVVYKLTTCVQLLLGETPERAWFSDPELKIPLRPYFELVKAVRNGHIHAFDKCRDQHADVFTRDNNMSLVTRLRNSVIKTGLRQINMSYSKISFKDVAKKLDLESAESAEFVCAKAIRDGVIDATIDHAQGTLQSAEVNDIYSTVEPQQAFHRRIQFCMEVHDDAVKAMRYPPGAHKSQHAEDQEDEDEKKTDEEIAKEIEAELEDDEGI